MYNGERIYIKLFSECFLICTFQIICFVIILIVNGHYPWGDFKATIKVFLSIHNKMLQYEFVKCFAFINMKKQDEVLTGLTNTASSCLITQFYLQFSIQLAALPRCTWGPSWWQNRQACFAVISLLIVDRTGRIPLPSVIPLCHWLSAALSCCPPCESPALLAVPSSV